MTRLYRPAQKRPAETIVALVDVVFFLLVFALLIGRMDATAPFDLTPPEAASGVDMPSGGLTAAVSANGDLALNGEPMSRTALLRAAERAIGASPKIRLRINADGRTALRHVLPLAGDLKEVGVREVVLVVTPDAG